MKLKHHLDLQIDSRDGLIALGLILLAFVAVALGTVALTGRPVQEGGSEVTLRVRPGHGLNDTQQRGIDRPGGAVEGRPDVVRP